MAIQVSVIMPIRNEQKSIAKTLDSVLRQQFPPDQFEVLVVDGQSTDATPQIVADYVAKHSNVALHDNPKRWSSAARNIGVRAARGEFLLVVDGHCELVDREYLTKVVDAFKRSGANCIGRPQPLEIVAATPLQRAIAAARRSPLGHHPDSFIYSDRDMFVPAHSVAVAYRREVFDRVGLFDERFDACEDVELNHRIDQAGLKCFFTPQVAVPYQPRGTLRGLFRQLVRYGKGRVRLMRKHPDTTSLKTLAPAFFVAGLIVGPVASLFSAICCWIFVSVLAVYAILILAGSLGALKNAGSLSAALWLPITFFTIHFASGWGQLLELVYGQRNLRGSEFRS